MKKTANIWEYKVGINDIVGNFVFMWKYRIRQVLLYQDGVSHSMDPFRSALLSQHTRASHWIGLFARCSTRERGIPVKVMCSTVSRLLSDKSSSWSDGRLENVLYFNTWEIKQNLHGIASFYEEPLATGHRQILHRASKFRAHPKNRIFSLCRMHNLIWVSETKYQLHPL